MKIKIILCCFLSSYMPHLYASEKNSEIKNHKIHYDARKLRSKGYSALYWLILFSIAYYKTYQDYPLLAHFLGILAIDNCINMLHYFQESQCAALEEERAFDIVREYIKYHNKAELVTESTLNS